MIKYKISSFVKKYTPGIIFVSVLLFSLCIWYFLLSAKLPVTWEYSDIARNLIKNHKFAYNHLYTEYMCFCPPLYSFLVALIYLVSNFNNLAVIFMQIIIFSFLCIALFEAGKNIFNQRVGFIASILLMMHPGILFYVLRNEHSMILDSFMITVSMLTMLMLYDKPVSLRRLVLSGIVLGLSFLSRGTFLILLPVFIFWIIFTFNQPFKKRLLLSFCLVLISVTVMLPWNLRNYFVTGKFILVGAATEESLWLGNNLNATGSSYDRLGRVVLTDLGGRDFLNQIYSLDEMSQREVFKEAAFNFIKGNPGKFIVLFLKKIYYFWWFSPQTGITYHYIEKIIYQVYYLFAVIGAFLGIWFSFKIKDKILHHKIYLLIGIFIGISFLQSFFYVEMRHRWAIEPMLLIFTAIGVSSIKQRSKT